MCDRKRIKNRALPDPLCSLRTMWIKDLSSTSQLTSLSPTFSFQFSGERLIADFSVTLPSTPGFFLTGRSSMQDTPYMNLVIGLTHHSLCGSVAEHRSAESEDLRYDSSWGLMTRRRNQLHLFLYGFMHMVFYGGET